MTQTLEYAPAPNLRRKRRVRIGLFLILITGLGIGALKFGHQIADKVRLLYWTRACMTFNPPPGTHVYRRVNIGATVAPPAGYLDANSPQMPRNSVPAEKSIRQSGSSEAEFSFAPNCWAGLLKIKSDDAVFDDENPIDENPIVFCHELRTATGNRRLVVVKFNRWIATDIGELLGESFQAAVFDSHAQMIRCEGQGSDWSGPALPGPTLIEAGQPDPTDASRFTIAYQWADGIRGLIDGQLQNDDTVTFSIRPGDGDVKSEEERSFGASH